MSAAVALLIPALPHSSILPILQNNLAEVSFTETRCSDRLQRTNQMGSLLERGVMVNSVVVLA